MLRTATVYLILFLAALSSLAQDIVMDPLRVERPSNKAAREEAERIQYQRLIANQVSGNGATAIDFLLHEQEWGKHSEANQDENKIGDTKKLDLPVDLNAAYRLRSKRPIELDFGVAQHGNFNFVWTGMILVEASTGIRLRIRDLNLPEGAELFVYSDLGQSFGPYTQQGPNGRGEFWTDTLFSELIWIQLEMPGVDSLRVNSPRDLENADLSFTIDSVAHFGENFSLGSAFINHTRNKACQGLRGERLESCFSNAACHKDIDAVINARQAIAYLVYKKDGTSDWYGCTGGLINSSGATANEPFLITAGHCIDSETEADSLESYFDYRNNDCFASASTDCGQAWNKRNKVSGADLMVAHNSSDGDYSLLKLSGFPDGTYYKFGWTTANKAYSAGEQFYRVSHPRSYQQAFSLHEVDTSVSICSGDDRPEFIYTLHIEGYTEEGSSGAPLIDSSSRVVGMDTGRCKDWVCDDTLQVRDSSFRHAYYSAMSPYLYPTYTKVQSIIVTEEDLGFGISRAVVQVQVTDLYDTPVSDAMVQMSLSGPINSNLNGVTDSDGWVTMNGINSLWSGTWTACVTTVTHSWLTYSAATSDETCDSN